MTIFNDVLPSASAQKRVSSRSLLGVQNWNNTRIDKMNNFEKWFYSMPLLRHLYTVYTLLFKHSEQVNKHCANKETVCVRPARGNRPSCTSWQNKLLS